MLYECERGDLNPHASLAVNSTKVLPSLTAPGEPTSFLERGG
jgi:hypothetical protein